MSYIPGFEVTEVIHEGVSTIIYRGYTNQERELVVIKTLKAEYPTAQDITYKEVQQYKSFAVQRKYMTMIDDALTKQQFILSLKGLTESTFSFSDR